MVRYSLLSGSTNLALCTICLMDLSCRAFFTSLDCASLLYVSFNVSIIHAAALFLHFLFPSIMDELESCDPLEAASLLTNTFASDLFDDVEHACTSEMYSSNIMF